MSIPGVKVNHLHGKIILVARRVDDPVDGTDLSLVARRAGNPIAGTSLRLVYGELVTIYMELCKDSSSDEPVGLTPRTP